MREGESDDIPSERNMELVQANLIEFARLPPFSAKYPEIWFTKADVLFALHGVERDDTKFHTVVWMLDRDSAALVYDIIVSPPKYHKYTVLKTSLLSALAARKLHKLMYKQRKKMPSVILERLMEFAGPNFSEQYLIRYWWAQYPKEMQILLAANESLPWKILGEIADRSWSDLLSEYMPISSLRAIEDVDRSQEPPAEEKICWYHATHLVYALKCEKPCKYHEEFLKRFQPRVIYLDGGWGTTPPSKIPWN